MLWASTSPNSSGTGRAHQCVEKHQLTLKGVKVKINQAVDKRSILSLLLESIVGQLLNQLVANSQLIRRGTNSSGFFFF